MIDIVRIAKNTIFLYIRMILVLAANFYAVRILLEVLGVEDYGLFNLIVGFVTLFTFLNGAMMSTVQRFLCYAMGKNVDAAPSPRHSQEPSTTAIFSLCFYLFLALAFLILLVSETVGLWFVYQKLNIPPERFRSAQIVYQLSIVVMLFKTMQIPYTALIISYERMNAFAKISIVEAVLTLGAAFAIKWTPGDNLIVYTVLYTLAQAVVCLTYALYCRRHFPEGKIQSFGKLKQSQNPSNPNNSNTPNNPNNSPSLLKQLSSFFSWSILGAVANMLKQQGLNVLLNIFFGVAFNATWAIANKIGMAVNQLVGNFQQAFNPQIVKLYAEEDKRQYYALVSNASRYSFLLLWFFALPLMVGCEFFLKIWLKGELPPQLVIFVNLSVVFVLCEAIAAPFWTAIQATGRIGVYQTVVSVLIGSALPIGWCALKAGAPAWSILVANVVISLVCHVFRILHLACRTGFGVRAYLLKSMLPSGLVIMLSLAFLFSERRFVPALASCWLLEMGLVAVVNVVVMVLIGSTSFERKLFLRKLAVKLNARGNV